MFPGSDYTYYVYVVDTLGNQNPPSRPVSVRTPDDTIAPTAPTNVTMYKQEVGRVFVSWTDATDNSAVPNIDLEYEYFVTPTPGIYSWTSGPHATIYTEAGVTYTMYVKSVDFTGNYSPPSNTITFTGI